MKVLLILFIPLLLTSCMSKATKEFISAESTKADNCQQRVLQTKLDIVNARKKNPPVTFTFTNEQNYVMMRMVDRMADITIASIESNSDDGISSCDDRVIALIEAESRRSGRIIGLGASALNMSGWLIGANILVDGYNDHGAASSSSTTYNGSRVISDSGNNSSGSNFSSSGTGLGNANAFEAGAGNQGAGILPRQINDSQDVSNSGAVDDIIVDPIPEPIILPAP